jgi:hypothetical protein
MLFWSELPGDRSLLCLTAGLCGVGSRCALRSGSPVRNAALADSQAERGVLGQAETGT